MRSNSLPVLFIFFIFFSCSVTKSGVDYTENRSRTPHSADDYTVNQSHSDDWMEEKKDRELEKSDKIKAEKVLRKKRKSTDRSEEFSTDRKETLARKKLLHRAEESLGASYRYGGNGPRSFDCSGFTKYCMRSVGIELARSSKFQSRQGKKISLKNAQKGDLIFFGRGKRIQHVGIITERSPSSLYVIHASSSSGVIIEDVLKSDYWRSRLLYAADVIGTADLKIVKSGK